MISNFNLNFKKAVKKFTSLSGIAAIRKSLISLIPVLLVGAFSLTIKAFPIDAYQNFLTNFLDGFLLRLFDVVYLSTFGFLSLFTCLSIGYYYALSHPSVKGGATIGCPLASISSFLILTGLNNLSTDTLGPKGMFIAIIASLGASWLFCFILSRKKGKMLLADGADANLNNALKMILPLAVTIIAFAVVNDVILLISKSSNVHDLLQDGFTGMFARIGSEFIAGLLFVFISSILWFFGIHGSDVLEGVALSVFSPDKITTNINLIQAGQAPTEIFSKQFFDVFVLMGGCGSAICLLLALLIFSKRKSNSNLAKMAAFPMLFNINEIMVFGLPIIYNPIMLIPFLSVPLVCFMTSFLAMKTGLVPLVTSPVEWTTPVILGGYMATGSVMGSLLQLLNIALGILIYRPFVKKFDEEKMENFKEDYERLVDILQKRELSREDFALTELGGADGEFAKSLAAEIEYALEKNKIEVYYQPQYNFDGDCFGAEALLRYQLENVGFVYPPLVIELAKESGKLQLLEQYVFEKACEDSTVLWQMSRKKIKISINVSGSSIQSKEFEEFLIELADNYNCENPLCIEITEQTAIVFDDELKNRIKRLKDAGYMFAIDDFSAGNTSLQFLQENLFDIVKLDGSIVQNCLTSERSNEIIKMIIELSKNLGFNVIAEFVSSEEIRDLLALAGCTLYQGWLYSPAIKYAELENILTLDRLMQEQL